MSGRPREFDKDRALAAAIDQFWSCGYEASSIADLLREMGISRQSAYDTFGDKRALFEQALRAYVQRGVATLGGILNEGPSPLARVRRLLHVIAERAVQSDGKGCLMTNTIVELAPHDPAIRELLSNTLRMLEDRVAAVLAEAVAAGEVSPRADPRRLARLVLTVMQGSLVLSRTRLHDSIQDAVRMAEEVISNS